MASHVFCRTLEQAELSGKGLSNTLGILPTTRMLEGAFCRCQMLTMAMERIVTVRGPMARSTNSFLHMHTHTHYSFVRPIPHALLDIKGCTQPTL